jgi:phosphoribosylanthranilate isomerase
MNNILVKICGLSTAPSPRHIAFDTARALGARVKGRAEKVALSVDADDTFLDAVVAALKPDFLQLHGKELPERLRALKARYSLPLIKAIPVEARGDLAAIAHYADAADRLLFDARAPRAATRPGGLGKPFDWHLLENIHPGVPFMLSGGLDPDNVAEALRITRAPGVDVSSGVERAPGEKDSEKILAFIRAARQAAADLMYPAA